MSDLTIESMPDDLRNRLEIRAARNQRSASREVVAILEQVLGREAPRLTLEEVDRLRVHGAKPLTDEIIREARTTGRP